LILELESFDAAQKISLDDLALFEFRSLDGETEQSFAFGFPSIDEIPRYGDNVQSADCANCQHITLHQLTHGSLLMLMVFADIELNAAHRCCI
jgi:hypothetical protein